MVRRKVIQLAGKTHVVSLPSKWVKRYGVKKGDEIEITENERSLILSTSNPKDVKKIFVDLSGLNERTIRWTLSALHKKGHDEIEVKYSNAKALCIISELMKDLFTGFAITKQSSNKCTIKSISKDSEEEFDAILRRAFLVTLSMGENIVDLMEKNKTKDAKEVLVLEKTNNQLTNFCERILIKKGNRISEDTCLLYVIVWNLEKIADDYKYICKEIIGRKKRINPNIIGIHKKTNDIFRGYYELFYKFDLAKLDKLSAERTLLLKEIKRSLKRTSQDAILLNHLSSMLNKTADFSASIVGLNQTNCL